MFRVASLSHSELHAQCAEERLQAVTPHTEAESEGMEQSKGAVVWQDRSCSPQKPSMPPESISWHLDFCGQSPE